MTTLAGTCPLAMSGLCWVSLTGQDMTAFGLPGGWGVDALVGRQTRIHSDLDLAVDVTQMALEHLLQAFGRHGSSGSMKRRISQGQAIRSTRALRRATHFIGAVLRRRIRPAAARDVVG